ncbi:MAG: hypothetical protein V3T19_03125 [Acidiferrobacterales bacterium]
MKGNAVVNQALFDNGTYVEKGMKRGRLARRYAVRFVFFNANNATGPSGSVD